LTESFLAKRRLVPDSALSNGHPIDDSALALARWKFICTEIAMSQNLLAGDLPVAQSSHKARRTGSAQLPALIDTALARVARLEMALAATGGALHDVNNLLTVLGGNLYLMTESVRHDPAALNKCRSARNAAERASTLIRELLSSAKDADDTVDVICPARHVLTMEPILRRSVGSKHRFCVSHSKNPWPVAASAAQLESAVANLVINASEAMEERGSIEICIDNQILDEACSLSLPVGEYVRLSVIDNGSGIPEDLLPRITEPLVTGKASGRGNGLGLSMVRRFAAQSAGGLRIDSVVGRGTRIEIWLPRAKEQVDGTR
jgi:signal transduction histidine kinase